VGEPRPWGPRWRSTGGAGAGARRRAHRKNCGGKLFCEMRERDGRIEDAAQVFDEMPIRTVLKDARVLLLDEVSRMQDAVGRMLQRHAGRTHAVREELQYGGCE
jgi:hypothetical protein